MNMIEAPQHLASALDSTTLTQSHPPTLTLHPPPHLSHTHKLTNRPLQLGIPTANLPVDASQTPWIESAKSGVYFGYASLSLPEAHPNRTAAEGQQFSTFPMVMSIGYNPFYKNTVRSAEVHVLHKFEKDFYDEHMRLLILGFIREEKDYKSLEALVDDINFDCDVAKKSVARTGWEPKNASPEGAEWLVKSL